MLLACNCTTIMVQKLCFSFSSPTLFIILYLSINYKKKANQVWIYGNKKMDFMLLKSISYLFKINSHKHWEAIFIQIKLFIIHSYTLSALHCDQKVAFIGCVWREMMPKGTAIIFDEWICWWANPSLSNCLLSCFPRIVCMALWCIEASLHRKQTMEFECLVIECNT